MYAVQAICQAVTITKIGWGFLFPSHEEKSTIPNSKFFSNYMSINSLKIFVKSAACIENGWK